MVPGERGRRGELDAVWGIGDARTNATVSWLVVGSLVLVAGSVLVRGDLLWAGFVVLVVVTTLVPALATDNWRRMPPWPLVALVALPVASRALWGGFGFDLLGGMAIAGFALLAVVDLQLLTPVRLTPGAAVVFVVVAAMGVAGLWALVRWLVSLYLGAVSVGTHADLMHSFTAATLGGLAAGLVFRRFFRRVRRLSALAAMEAERP